MIRLALPALIALAIALFTAGDRTAGVQSAGFNALSIDMEIAGNDADSLGSRQECREALPGATIIIDVTVEGISAATPLLSYQYMFLFPGPTIAITDHEPIKIDSNPGSQLFNVSDPLPDLDGVWTAVALDTGEGPDVYETGSGVLDRLTLEVGTDAAPGTYLLSLSDAVLIDPNTMPYSPSVTRNARLAIGESCAGSTPVPPVTATATAAPTGDVPGGPTGEPTAPTSVTPSPPGGPNGADTATPTATGGAGGSSSPTAVPSGTVSPNPSGPSGGSNDGDDGGLSTAVIVLILLAGLAAVSIAGTLAYRRYRSERGGTPGDQAD